MNSGYLTTFLIVVYFFSLWILTRFKPAYISKRKLQLFRALFPSWRFYEEICYMPALYYRESKDGLIFSEWKSGHEKLRRSFSSVLINPKGNLEHAYNSLLQQLESDKEDTDEEKSNDLEFSTSYQLTKNLIEFKIKSSNSDSNYFQFKLTSTLQGAPEDKEDILISLVHKK